MLSREDQRGGSMKSARLSDISKTSRWMQKRATRKANLDARLWGHDQGLTHEQNPLYFQNRQEYNNIAAWLAAMAARDAQQQPLGMAPAAGPQGAFEYPHSGPFESGTEEWRTLGRDIGGVAHAVGNWWGQNAGRAGNGFDNGLRSAGDWIYRAATGR